MAGSLHVNVQYDGHQPKPASPLKTCRAAHTNSQRRHQSQRKFQNSMKDTKELRKDLPRITRPKDRRRRLFQRLLPSGQSSTVANSTRMKQGKRASGNLHTADGSRVPLEIQIVPLSSDITDQVSAVGDGSSSATERVLEAKSSFAAQGVSFLKTLIVFSVAIVLLMMVVESVHDLEQDPLEELNHLNGRALRERLHAVFPQLNASITSLAATLHHSTVTTTADQNIGASLAEQGAAVHSPIVMIPGFVTSGLEIWTAKDCMKRFFRQRVWTAFTGAASLLVEKDCWVEHMMLDPKTGGDPENIRVRAAEGFVAADYFLMNYWVWGKLIENLAQVGYTPSDMVMLSYDWRLSFQLLEERDGYLSNLKARIETLHKTTGKKVVIATHSMGALLTHYFFGWVTSPERDGGGGGGSNWVDKHVEAYVNIAGPHLGVPKAATALLSGEMSDTVFGGRIATFVEHFLPRRLRRDLFNSWGSLWAMLPKGGHRLWDFGADMCEARDDIDPFCPSSDKDLSPLVAMTDSLIKGNFTVDESVEHLEPLLAKLASKQTHSTESLLSFLQDFGRKTRPTYRQLGKDEKGRIWYDPSRFPLPHAPKMRIYCLYGTGLPTERGYYYKRNWEESDGQLLSQPPLIIDTEAKDNNATVGIRYANGDGSVPLLSLGYICADAWQRPNSGLNPSKAKVFTREYEHKAEFCVDDPMRKGPTSSDHVDILGNKNMIGDFVRIVSGFESDAVDRNRISSNILEIAAAINDQPNGGLFRKKWW